MTVPQGTVAEILEWVGDDAARAQEALDAEYSGAGRSTLITQLEAIATKEANTVTETATTYDEETGLAPAAVPPEEVYLDPEDEGTVVGAIHLRDAEVEVDAAPEPSETGIAAEQVLYLQGIAGTNGLVLNLNGAYYAFTPSLLGALKGVVERGVAAVTF